MLCFLHPVADIYSDRGVKVTAMQNLQLSVLDQAPVAEGSSAGEALDRSVDLAQHTEALGYKRFWMSEHHAMATLACSAPEVVLGRIGAATHSIRIGSGGVMLPHYSAFKVAEVFSTLAAMYPGRVDLGVGRAPGGGPWSRRHCGAIGGACLPMTFRSRWRSCWHGWGKAPGFRHDTHSGEYDFPLRPWMEDRKCGCLGQACGGPWRLRNGGCRMRLRTSSARWRQGRHWKVTGVHFCRQAIQPGSVRRMELRLSV